jgi:hypothetical protein
MNVGDPILERDDLARDAKVEIHAHKDHHHDREAGPDHDLGLAVFLLQLAVGRQHDRARRAEGGRGCRVGDPAQD